MHAAYPSPRSTFIPLQTLHVVRIRGRHARALAPLVAIFGFGASGVFVFFAAAAAVRISHVTAFRFPLPEHSLLCVPPLWCRPVATPCGSATRSNSRSLVSRESDTNGM